MDSIILKHYKIYIAPQDCEINFNGKKISPLSRFKPSKIEAEETDSIYRSQYVSIRIHQLDKQYSDSAGYDSNEWKQVKDSYQSTRSEVISRIKRKEKYYLEEFDRFLWGYKNEYGEKLIFIQFDPHKPKYFSVD